jgi:hypothetical protein
MNTRTPLENTALLWAAASAGLMIVGAIGPWATAVGGLASVGGLDGGRDGWFVVVVAAISLVVLAAVYFGSSLRIAWSLPVLGLLGLAVAAIDRRDVADAGRGPGIGDVLTGQDDGSVETGIEVGWGLNLAMGASFSLVVASVVLLWAARSSTVNAEEPLSD